MDTRRRQGLVGLFMLCSVLAFLFLAYRVSNLNHNLSGPTYLVQARFDNIGHLQLRAPVKLAGVTVGEVDNIGLDPNTFQAVVSLRLSEHFKIPADSSASILTAGLLGANYIGLTVGFDETFLQAGAIITETHSALILEKIIGRLLFSFSGQSNQKSSQ